ncbi:MAG: tRNA (adenosine(37)-N6)-dimethylallyltransferase MiaA [Nocardioidaceae bacterium]
MKRSGRVVAVVGPTAAGKSDLSVALARRSGAEVVNADSMQLYRGMDIGTAKLGPPQRCGVPHHLLDVLDVTEPATVAEFQSWARSVIGDCHARDILPLLVGGSALYLRAVLDDFAFPGTDQRIRERLETELERIGPKAMHDRLAEHDLDAATHILPSNGRRVVRALEVIEMTGRPYTATLPSHTFVYDDVTVIGLAVARDVLADRIEDRVERMWEAGFVEEVRGLARRGLAGSRTASRALGYAQVLAYLAGDCTEEEAKEATIRGTRRFARRQDAWFRKDPRIVWLEYDAPDLLDRAWALVHESEPTG